MKPINANPLRWPLWGKLASIAVVLVACCWIVAWLFIPARIDIAPSPWIGRSASQPAAVFEWPEKRMSIVLLGTGKMLSTELHGYSWPIDCMENPIIYGVQSLPPEFLGVSTEILIWAWESRDQTLLDQDYKEFCPLVMLETKDSEIVVALGADQLIRRRTMIGFERTWAHNRLHDWRECRYEEGLPIPLHECNPVPKMLDPNRLHGATFDDVICQELEVDSHFPYYVLTTNDYWIKAMVDDWVGSGAPHLENAQGWMIISNPLLHGDGNGCKLVKPRKNYRE